MGLPFLANLNSAQCQYLTRKQVVTFYLPIKDACPVPGMNWNPVQDGDYEILKTSTIEGWNLFIQVMGSSLTLLFPYFNNNYSSYSVKHCGQSTKQERPSLNPHVVHQGHVTSAKVILL